MAHDASRTGDGAAWRVAAPGPARPVLATGAAAAAASSRTRAPVSDGTTTTSPGALMFSSRACFVVLSSAHFIFVR